MKTRLAMRMLAMPLITVTLAFGQAQRGGGAAAQQGGAAAAAGARGPAAAPMALTTTGWMDGTVIPNKFTQAAAMAVSPALTWTNVPMGTQSFVLHFHDPDVSIQKGTGDQVHWLVWNIPATTTSFAEGMPQGPTLPDGSKFDGVAGLREVLATHQEDFARTFTEKLMSYALGRGVEYADLPTVRSIAHDAGQNGYRWSSVILGITNSPPFRMSVAGGEAEKIARK